MSEFITIPLSKTGKYAGMYEAIIDEVDKDLALISWHVHIITDSHIYAVRANGRGKNAQLHRIILERKLERKLLSSEHVDHINHNSLDARRQNLRLASHSQNMMNRKMQSNNKTGYRGVYKEGTRYRAQIHANNKKITLGTFDTPEKAYAAYCEAAIKYHGEFANLT